MPACERCGGVRKGRGRGWCSSTACREAEKEQAEKAKRLRREERAEKAAGKRGPCPGEAGRRPSQCSLEAREVKRLRKEEREEKAAGQRGPCPGEAGPGRRADSAAALLAVVKLE